MQIVSKPQFNQLEALQFRVENLASDPGSPVEGQIWYNTTSDTYKGYANGTVIEFATAADIANLQTQITNIGTFQGAYDASGNTAPSGVGIEAGDYYRISVGGTISGIIGGSAVLEPGDLLFANVDTPGSAGDWFAIQTNLDSSGLGGGGNTTERQVLATNLVANTAIDLNTATSPTFATILSVHVSDANNEVVHVKWDPSTDEIESEIALTGVNIIVAGIQ